MLLNFGNKFHSSDHSNRDGGMHVFDSSDHVLASGPDVRSKN